MLYLLVGENVYRRDVEVSRLAAGRAVERLSGEELTPERLGEVFAGQTLFATDVVKVIDEMSGNSAVWAVLESWVERTGETNIILLEQKLDKRTKVYKLLQKHATVVTCDYWTDRQRPLAIRWLKDYAAQHKVSLPAELYDEMVERAIRPSDTSKDAIIDQQRLARAVEQLKLADTIDRRALDTVLAPSAHENVFQLLSAALAGDVRMVHSMIPGLSRDQDGHRMMGLLGSQIGSLTALVLAGDRPPDQVASDIGAHPFALKQLTQYSRQLGRRDIAHVVAALTDADRRLKRSQAEPWVLIEKAMIEIALAQQKSRS